MHRHRSVGTHLRGAWLGAAGLVVALVAACGQGSATATPASTTAAATAGAVSSSPLVGAWQTAITMADLEAGGVADPGLQTENSGRFIWTFTPDGKWTQIQQSLEGAKLNNPVFGGTWTVDGGNLVAVTEFPTEYRDSGLHYTWAIEGSELRVDLLDPPDPMLPIIMEAHPWTRTQ